MEAGAASVVAAVGGASREAMEAELGEEPEGSKEPETGSVQTRESFDPVKTPSAEMGSTLCPRSKLRRTEANQT